MRRRSLELARLQATTAEIAAALRDELTTGPTPVVPKNTVTRFIRDLGKGRVLEDARQAGRLLPLEVLHKAARGGDVAAAVQLQKRQELLDGIDPALLREIKRWMGLEPGAAVAEVERFLVKLRAA